MRERKLHPASAVLNQLGIDNKRNQPLSKSADKVLYSSDDLHQAMKNAYLFHFNQNSQKTRAAQRLETAKSKINNQLGDLESILALHANKIT